ncbi:flagellar hook-associated protein FlgK [Methylobacterium sp. WL103]|uniref:flagellar hook-associated protein FlgK n=1 Tax=Methylobacterium sp. WL103 TaxID=2603891 RepID=UPI0011C7A68A|nr:flagellar hook-associated protein FlgK [Methylobacterium sp. WL103]TXN07855.1 flagellar hook-associated protein FlgK [Methylobacterium sp. WL103]
MPLNALQTATAGLKATQTAMGLVSQNVANAGTAGYVKRTIATVSSGPGNSGVSVGAITRSFDAAALKQLRLETAGSAYTSTKADITGQVGSLFGTPGSTTALDGLVNSFTGSLQNLAANQTSAAARSTVLSTASNLANSINGIANSVQALRTGIESSLGSQTASASSLLGGIAALNVKIQSTTDDLTLADLKDQRDQKVTELSGYLDVQTAEQRDGTLSITTSSGVNLVTGGTAATLGFDGRTTLGANSTYSTDPDQRSVGTITATTPGGGKIDLGAPGVLRSGSIAANLELRDTTLPQVQRQLDDLAGGMASALTDTSTSGTVSGSGSTTDLSGMQSGNTLTLAVTAADGSTRNIILVASQGATKSVDPSQTDDGTALAQTFDISGGPTTYKAKIQEALDGLAARASALGLKNVPSLTASGTGANVTVTGGGTSKVVAATATKTVPTSATDFASAYPQVALFVDGSNKGLFTGSFDAGSQLTGFAQRITVNPALSANTAVLTAQGATNTGTGATRAQFAFDALTTAQQTFSSSSGIGGVAAPYKTSVITFAQDVIAAQGAAAANAANLDAGQSVALSTAQGRFAKSAGVNVDEEMSNLIALQTAYSANARVLTAARDMLDTLLRI